MSGYGFSIPGYRRIISAFLDKGYRATGYRAFTGTGAELLLRHDIDMSLDHAVLQAETNEALGVSATFFFLLTSEQYNLCAAPGREALKRVLGAGQRIGLHFDAALYPPDDDLQQRATEECAMLASLCGCLLEAVSFHRPVRALQGLAGSFAGLPHAYEPRFFSETAYCSDSRGGFHHGGPLEREAFRAGQPMHLLTHPIWWMREQAAAPVDVLLDFITDRAAHLRVNLAENCGPFADYLASQE